MPARVLPTSFKVRRPQTIGGVAKVAGDTVTASAAKTQYGTKLAALVNRGYLDPVPPMYPETAERTAARAAGVPRATSTFYLSPSELASL